MSCRFAGTLSGVVVLILCSSPVSASSSSSSRTSEFLYEVAQEYQAAGRTDEAIDQLEKLLLIDPSNEAAQRELEALTARRAQRQLVMAQALDAFQPRAQTPPIVDRPYPVMVSTQRPLGRGQGLRLPDPSVNGVEWFYVFGREGNPTYGAEPHPQVIFIELPADSGGSLTIRILDADLRGRHDEHDGGPNTSTAFRVLSGSTRLDERLVGPETPDKTVLEFGPYPFSAGERQGDRVLFRVEAEGLDGNDNNLFALQVVPSNAEAFSYHPAIRLAPREGDLMHFFPEVPEGTAQVVESNYDLDPDGGNAHLILPRPPEGGLPRAIRLQRSDTGASAPTEIPVPPHATGTRWLYRITKATQPRGNMSLALTDQDGRPLRIYLTQGERPAPSPVVTAPPRPVPKVAGACNVFEFDGSQSSDPDGQPLTYRWDFGDGTTGEGIQTVHRYASAGDYQVMLTVKDPTSTDCCEAQAQQAIHVNTPPTAALDAPAKACAGAPVALSAAQSTDTPGDRLTYRWDFGDGTTGEGAEITHAYARGGSYRVTVLVDDNQGTSCSVDQATATVRVNSPPIAKVPGPVTVCSRNAEEPLNVALSAEGSHDPDRDTLSYAWDFGDGTRGDGLEVAHVYDRGGAYTATLTVDDGSGTSCSIDTAAVPVRLNRAPSVRALPTLSACPGQPLSVDASAHAADPDGDALAYRWDFGDGHTETGAAITHTYASSGTYRLNLTVDDGSGMACGTASTDATAHINAPPAAKIIIRGTQGEAR